MATTTPNFGWSVPTSSDLVKNGATAIETLGDSIDASLVDLKGGTTGQVLKKNTNTDMDFVWSSDSAGMTNPMTTTGDTIYSSSGSTPARLGIGSTGQVLTVAAGLPSWATPSGSGFVGCSLYKSAAQTISNTTFTAITFNSESFDTDAFHSTATNTSRITIPAGKAGKYLLHGTIGYGGGTLYRSAAIYKNGAAEKYVVATLGAGNDDAGRLSFACTLDLAVADYVELYFYHASGGNLDVEGTITRTSFYATYEGA